MACHLLQLAAALNQMGVAKRSKILQECPPEVLEELSNYSNAAIRNEMKAFQRQSKPVAPTLALEGLSQDISSVFNTAVKAVLGIATDVGANAGSLLSPTPMAGFSAPATPKR